MCAISFEKQELKRESTETFDYNYKYWNQKHLKENVEGMWL